MSIEKLLVLMYLISLGVALQIASPQILISLLLILILILMSKIDTKYESIKLRETLTGNLDSIRQKVDSITQKIDSIPKTDDIKAGFNRDILFLDGKISELRNEYTVEMEKQYQELARKILGLENSIGEIRRTVGAAFGSLEERLESIKENE